MLYLHIQYEDCRSLMEVLRSGTDERAAEGALAAHAIGKLICAINNCQDYGALIELAAKVEEL